MPITLLPEPPSRSDPQNFPARADAFMSALPTFAQQLNELAADVTGKQTTAVQAATSAANDAQAAAQSEGNAADSALAASASAATAVAAAGSAQTYRDAAAGSALAAATSAASVDIANLSTDYFGPTEPAITWPGMTWGDSARNLLWRRNGANTEWVLIGLLFVPGILVLPTAPTSRLSDVIYVLDRGQILRWQTIGTYTGYASEEVGDFRWGTSITPKPGTELLIGQTRDRTLPQYAALAAWAEVNGHMVPSGSWTKGAFHFSMLSGNNMRMPDIRDMFIRATGTDADTANARDLGSTQFDAFKSHRHDTWATHQVIADYGATGGNLISNASGTAWRSNATLTDGGGLSETRPRNTALHPVIAL